MCPSASPQPASSHSAWASSLPALHGGYPPPFGLFQGQSWGRAASPSPVCNFRPGQAGSSRLQSRRLDWTRLLDGSTARGPVSSLGSCAWMKRGRGGAGPPVRLPRRQWQTAWRLAAGVRRLGCALVVKGCCCQRPAMQSSPLEEPCHACLRPRRRGLVQHEAAQVTPASETRRFGSGSSHTISSSRLGKQPCQRDWSSASHHWRDGASRAARPWTNPGKQRCHHRRRAWLAWQRRQPPSCLQQPVWHGIAANRVADRGRRNLRIPT